MSKGDQGPYFGQRGWLGQFHSEKVPSATGRYTKEVHRVNVVIDFHIGSQGTEYIVGNKCTYADLMFIPYARALNTVIAPGTSQLFPRLDRYQSFLFNLKKSTISLYWKYDT